LGTQEERVMPNFAVQVRHGIPSFGEVLAEGPWPLPPQLSSAPASIASPEDAVDKTLQAEGISLAGEEW